MLQTLTAAVTAEERRGQHGPLELREERVVNLRQDAAARCWWLGWPLGFGLQPVRHVEPLADLKI